MSDTSAHLLWPADPEQESASQLQIDVDDGNTSPGCPVTVEARVAISGQEDVRAVIRVQGLEPAWCPPPQAVTVSPGVAARLFVELTPAAGTPPGCYLWSLTAEVLDRPMLATTAQLQVDRPKPTAPAPRRSRRRPITMLAIAVAVLIATAVAVTVFAPSPKPTPSATGPRRVPPTARPSGTATAAAVPDLVLLKGTVLAEKGKHPTRITVVRLNLKDLNGSRPPTGSSPVPEAPGVEKRVRGKHWSLSLPPGLYGLTFSKPGYVSESIVVATAVAGTVPPPHVRLDQIAPTATDSAPTG
jgi:hypothetical protein